MIKKFFLKIIKLYQLFISPVMIHNCRFWPSCSEYSLLAITKYGAIGGILVSFKRVLRCYPWSKGGIDLP